MLAAAFCAISTMCGGSPGLAEMSGTRKLLIQPALLLRCGFALSQVKKPSLLNVRLLSKPAELLRPSHRSHRPDVTRALPTPRQTGDNPGPSTRPGNLPVSHRRPPLPGLAVVCHRQQAPSKAMPQDPGTSSYGPSGSCSPRVAPAAGYRTRHVGDRPSAVTRSPGPSQRWAQPAAGPGAGAPPAAPREGQLRLARGWPAAPGPGALGGGAAEGAAGARWPREGAGEAGERWRAGMAGGGGGGGAAERGLR